MNTAGLYILYLLASEKDATGVVTLVYQYWKIIMFYSFLMHYPKSRIYHKIAKWERYRGWKKELQR